MKENAFDISTVCYAFWFFGKAGNWWSKILSSWGRIKEIVDNYSTVAASMDMIKRDDLTLGEKHLSMAATHFFTQFYWGQWNVTVLVAQ